MRARNPVLSWIGRILFDLKQVGAFHCGIRGFDRNCILALGLRMPGMEFATELVVRAALAGCSIGIGTIFTGLLASLLALDRVSPGTSAPAALEQQARPELARAELAAQSQSAARPVSH